MVNKELSGTVIKKILLGIIIFAVFALIDILVEKGRMQDRGQRYMEQEKGQTDFKK